MSFKLTKKDFHRPTAAWYSEYLQSPKWIAFKSEIVRKRGDLCERCKTKLHFSLHHKTYARLFNELQVDVELLCQDCHYLAHKLDDIPYLFLIYVEAIAEVKRSLNELKHEPQIQKAKARKREITDGV